MERLLIRGGRLIDPGNGIDGVRDLAIAEGRIVAVGQPPAGFTPERVIDARSQIVCPGLIDLSARLREPGAEYKAEIVTETRAAAARGITTLVVPPDTEPVIDETAVVELIRRRAEAAGGARVLMLGALTRGLAGEQLAGMAALKSAGCIGVSNAARPIVNTAVLRRALEYAATYEMTVFLDPVDHWLAADGCAHDGEVATRLGLPGIPTAAETAILARDLALIEDIGVRVHFCRLSSARSVAMIARAQADGLPVSADVAIHHLHLSEHDLDQFDSQCHVLPPLRSRADRDGLRKGVARGVLAAICSDHQPHEPDAKSQPFSATEPGISGLDTLLGLGLRLVEEDVLALPALIERLSTGPARVLGLPLGQLGVGAPADVCVFDLGRRWTLTADTMLSRGHNSPFLGSELFGRVNYTILQGRVAIQSEMSMR